MFYLIYLFHSGDWRLEVCSNGIRSIISVDIYGCCTCWYCWYHTTSPNALRWQRAIGHKAFRNRSCNGSTNGRCQQGLMLIEDNIAQYNIKRSLHKPYTFMKLQDYLYWYSLKLVNHDDIQCVTKSYACYKNKDKRWVLILIILGSSSSSMTTIFYNCQNIRCLERNLKHKNRRDKRIISK